MEIRFITWRWGMVDNVRAVNDDPQYRTKIFKADGSLSKTMQDIFKMAIADAMVEGNDITIEVVKGREGKNVRKKK